MVTMVTMPTDDLSNVGDIPEGGSLDTSHYGD